MWIFKKKKKIRRTLEPKNVEFYDKFSEKLSNPKTWIFIKKNFQKSFRIQKCGFFRKIFRRRRNIFRRNIESRNVDFLRKKIQKKIQFKKKNVESWIFKEKFKRTYEFRKKYWIQKRWFIKKIESRNLDI